jgi:hypothetical protein
MLGGSAALWHFGSAMRREGASRSRDSFVNCPGQGGARTHNPHSPNRTIDTIHELAYSAIILCLGLSLLSYKCNKNGRVVLSQRIDRWGFRVLLIAYVAAVAVVVASAIARG